MSDPLDLSASTWTDVARLEKGFVALFPVGSTEAHGPHLPLATDVVIARGMAERAARLLAGKGIPAVILPALPYAVTECAAEFPGTISVGSEVVQGLIVDVAVSLSKQGAALLCLASAHLEPAHRQCLSGAVERARQRGAALLFPDCVKKPYALRLGEEFKSGACHAGRYETSLVQALRPGWVKEDLRRGLPEFPVSLSRGFAEGKRTFREMGGELAYFGDPAAASADEGEELLQALAVMLVEEVEKAL